jgi:hypothetical protein
VMLAKAQHDSVDEYLEEWWRGGKGIGFCIPSPGNSSI